MKIRNLNPIVFLALILSAFACNDEAANSVSADDMLGMTTIQTDQIDATLNGETQSLTARLSENDSDPNGGYTLIIGGLIPNDVVNVPVSVKPKGDKLYISSKSPVGAYSEIEITGIYTQIPAKGLLPAEPHLVMDIQYNVRSQVTDKPYVFDLSDNPFCMLSHYSGVSEIDGTEVNNSDVIRDAAAALNREFAKNGKKIRLTFDPSGILTVDTLGSGNSDWQSINRVRYWMPSDDRESIVIGLNDDERAIFNNLWFGEPLDSDYSVYFTSQPLTISIKHYGDRANFTIMHVLQYDLLCSFISYKRELRQWSATETQCLKVLKDQVYKDRTDHGSYSSIWAIQASTEN